MKRNFIYAALILIVLALYGHPVIAAPKEKRAMKDPATFKSAQDYIEYFRQGGSMDDVDQYPRGLPGLMIGNRPDPEAMKALGEVLATSDYDPDKHDVRESIVRLLGNIRHFTDTGGVLLAPEVIELLVGPGFAKLDYARNTAMGILAWDTLPTMLSRYGDIFTEELKRQADYNILLLIAKAKAFQAREEVERLSQLSEWRNSPSSQDWDAMRVARAALGNTEVEDEFIADVARIEAAGNGKVLRVSYGNDMDIALFQLAEIGTPKSLRAICPRLRSPFVNEYLSSECSVRRSSVRLNAMDALYYAFPGRREELDSRKVRDRTDYIRAEQVCVEELCFDFTGIPEPDFFTQGCPPFDE